MTDTPKPSSGLATMHPAYFALVMATGIVSIGSQLLGYRPVAIALYALNTVSYPALLVLSVLRIIRYPDRVRADVFHHGRSVGFFTTVAATSVYGSQSFVVFGLTEVALVLLAAAALLWVGLTYGVFTVLTVKSEKPSLAEGINGGWLVAVVASQSVAVLSAQLAPSVSTFRGELLFVAIAMWLGGSMLYFWIISLIFYRYTFFTMNPGDLAPPYWINMGAAAISALAGTMLVSAADHSPVVAQTLPFIRGFTLLWWATATWWIPMLAILGVWRHVYRRFPLAYDPLYWGGVFPIGMYTVATFRLSRAIDAPYLEVIPRGFIFVAFAAWGAAFLGMLTSLVRPKRAV